MEALVVSADVSSLRAIAGYVSDAARAAGLSAYRVYQLRLAVDEIATNIITHGYDASAEPGELRVRATHQEDKLHILLEDDGHPFDPTRLPPPAIHLPPEQRQEGGLGVYLACWSVDHVAYDQGPDGNRTHLVIHCDS